MMRQIIPFLFALLLSLGLNAQKSCCDVASVCTNQFAQLANDAAFRRSHENPLPFSYKSEKGQMISFATSDGTNANGFLLKATKKSKKYLFVYQEWWGLNDYIKQEAEKMYNEFGGEINVIAVDLYDGKIATTREEAGKLMQGSNEKRCESIIKGAMKFAGKKAKIASIGWCFGGGWSLRSAVLEGKQAVACVIYYGMPVKEVETLKKLNCDVLGLFAGREQWISPAIVAEFEKNMKAADKKVTIKSFDAEHAFANPSNPKHDKLASEEAYTMATDYLKKAFQ
jgi:carboxymethylenebutenolidase